jgi:anti-sigma factor RsiW
MNCADAQSLLSEHALSILDPPRRAEVESHLSACAACAARAAETARAAGELRAAIERDTPLTAPRADVLAILSLAKRDGSSSRPGAPIAEKSWRAPFLRWAPLAAAVFLAGVGVGALATASAQMGKLTTQTERMTRRIETLEDSAPIIAERARDEARAAVIPVSQEFARELSARDERWLGELEALIHFIRRAREADRDALADTREGLLETQGAVLRVAEQIPTFR